MTEIVTEQDKRNAQEFESIVQSLEQSVGRSIC